MSQPPIIVLKFGSSVLPSRRALGAAIAEIYRELRQARRVIAVVSAFGGSTDALYAKARRYGRADDPCARALLVSTAELAAAGELALALARAGVSAEVFDPWRAGLLAHGHPEDSELVGVDVGKLRAALEQNSVVVLPGFIARDSAGRSVLLGRGGSDLTALFVAARLSAQVRLIKDVDGIHSADPASEPDARRYARLSWDEALAIGGEVVQEKALILARDLRLEFEVARLGSRAGTRIGAASARWHPLTPATRPLRVAVCGLGTVGYGVWRELTRRKRLFEVVGVLVRGSRKRRPRRVPLELLTTDSDELFAAQPDVLVELLGGIDEPDRLLSAANPSQTWRVLAARRCTTRRRWVAHSRRSSVCARSLLACPSCACAAS